jgi:hypothetical protein
VNANSCIEEFDPATSRLVGTVDTQVRPLRSRAARDTRRTAEPAIDAGPRAPEHRTRPSPVRRRGAVVPAGLAPPTVTAVPTALEPNERVSGYAAARPSVLTRSRHARDVLVG